MSRHARRLLPAALATVLAAGCGSSPRTREASGPTGDPPPASRGSGGATISGTPGTPGTPRDPFAPGPLVGMPPPLSPTDVYAAAGPNMLSPAVRGHRALVYVPNTESDDVYVIDQKTFKVIDRFPGGAEPQHVVPSYDLSTLYVAADEVPGGSLTPIDPKTGRPGRPFFVHDPYNLYFTPDGKFAVVVAEAYRRLDFYDPKTWKVVQQLSVPDCEGVDHLDFTADGRLMLASCEFAGRMVVVDVARRAVVRTIALSGGPDGMPQDVKLSPDGDTFYVADMVAGGVYLFDGSATKEIGFVPTGAGAHGLYVDRSSRRLFVTNRGEGSISVLDLATRKVATTWRLPDGGSPDMGGLSADGRVLWLSGRYHGVVYAIDSTSGRLLATIPVGDGPHGLCVWPQPGRYSLGHTGILR